MIFMGSTKGKRPVIKLSKNAKGYYDPANPKKVIWIWAQTWFDAPGKDEPEWGKEQGNHIVIENLEIKNGNGGIMVRVENKSVFSGFTFRNLYIHDMFTDGGAAFQLNPRQHDQKFAAQYSGILIENCRAERINRSFITGDGLKNCTIRNNVFSYSAGPGMVIGLTSNLIIRGNIINSSGSRIDPKYFGRESCGWIIYCNDVLVEKNKFNHSGSSPSQFPLFCTNSSSKR